MTLRAIALATICLTVADPPRLPTGLRLDPAGRSIPVGNMPLAALASHDGRLEQRWRYALRVGRCS
jgi:hypothetical protein